ncbi:Bromodomain-containing protein 3 [Taenia solium]|eukprot:TsM_000872100 transcript=TsM_000872100 gene=TsM_000872100
MSLALPDRWRFIISIMAGTHSTDSSKELAIARQILNYIMSPSNANISLPFMYRIDAQALDLPKYDEIVRFPMWLGKKKLDQNKYPGLREFVCDFRLILVNCFRYNGISSRMGRIAEKLETLFEQKLQLLPQELRAKTSLHASLGCGSTQHDANDNAWTLVHSGPIRRRVSTRHYGGNLDSQISHPVRGLMEELEHSMPLQEIGGSGASFAAGPSSTNFATAFLYETSPGLPVTTANSYALLVARLTEWQRRQHEADLVASWKDWWQANTRARTHLSQLRKCPQSFDCSRYYFSTGEHMPPIGSLHLKVLVALTNRFLQAFQLLWLMDHYLKFSDAMAVGTTLYHVVAAAFHGDAAMESAMLPLTTSSTSSPRRFSLTELELGVCAAPQASLCLSACISRLLHTPREREAVDSAIVALKKRQEQQRSEVVNNGVTSAASAMLTEEDEPEDSGEAGEESTRLASRRLQSSHVNTVKTLAVPPYEVWERRLAERLAQLYQDMPPEKRTEDPVRLERRYGVSQAFFNVCGKDQSPLEKKRFHELTAQQQAHILFALASNVLLSNANFGLGENLRASMDKHFVWGATRPTIIGFDAFRDLTFFHFPEIMLSEAPRIMQYSFPPSDALDADYFSSSSLDLLPSPPPTLGSSVSLPGAVGRLPTWMEPELAHFVRSHLLTLMEREVEVVGARCSKQRDSSNNRKAIKKVRSKIRSLTLLMEPFQTTEKDSKTLKGKGKAKAKRKKVELELVQSSMDVKLADFAFVNRISCGIVPASAVYARKAGGQSSRSSLRAVESSASLAESTATHTNISEAPTPNPPKFFQGEEEEEEEDDSNLPESFHHSEEEEGNGVDSQSNGVLKKDNSDLDCTGSNGSTASTIPFCEASDDGKTTPTVDELKKEDESAVAVGSVIEDPMVSKCNGFSTMEKEEEVKDAGETVGNDLTISTTDRDEVSSCGRVKEEASGEKKVKEVGELIAKVAESEVDMGHSFDTVVHDLESFHVFQHDIASRLATGRRLLDELSTACEAVESVKTMETPAADNDDCSTLRAVIDRIAVELGDAVLKRIKADPQLAAALQQQQVVKVEAEQVDVEKPKAKVEEEEEEAIGAKPSKNPLKRRKLGLSTPRPRKSARRSRAEAMATTEAVEAEVEAESKPISTVRHLLRLHEEALASLTELAGSLNALEAEAKSNEEDHLAAERLTGLLLRKDIEARQPKPVEVSVSVLVAKPKPKPRLSITSPTSQTQTQTQPLSQPRPSIPPVENRIVSRHPLRPLHPPSISVPTTGFHLTSPPSVSRVPTQPPPIFIRRAPPPPPAQPSTHRPRRIFRFYDTLFTEEGRPVRLEANGAVVYIPPESVPLGHRQMAMQMIERFRASSAAAATATPPS